MLPKRYQQDSGGHMYLAPFKLIEGGAGAPMVQGWCRFDDVVEAIGQIDAELDDEQRANATLRDEALVMEKASYQVEELCAAMDIPWTGDVSADLTKVIIKVVQWRHRLKEGDGYKSP